MTRMHYDKVEDAIVRIPAILVGMTHVWNAEMGDAAT